MSQEQSPATLGEWYVVPGTDRMPAYICTDPAKHLETEIAVLYGKGGTEKAQRIVAAVNASMRSETACKAILVESPGIGEVKWCDPCGLYFGKDQSCPSTRSAIRESEPDEDGERYRWFRNECSWARRSDIVDVAAEEPDLLDHHIDKGRCGL